jgi:hypothetical protein
VDCADCCATYSRKIRSLLAIFSSEPLIDVSALSKLINANSIMARSIGHITDIVCCSLRCSHGSSGIRASHASNLVLPAVRGSWQWNDMPKQSTLRPAWRSWCSALIPAPQDYRDIPYLWQSGYFAMDVPKLKARLKSARLILGDVAQTLRGFTEQENPPPIGFIAFDLDYYSSTVTALKIFETNHRYLLPRVACYFDDMVGDIDWAYNEFTGELLAIKEFNANHESIKIAPVSGLRFSGGRIPQMWHEQIFVAHLFTHPDYGKPIAELTQIPLAAE